jgi:MFS family permease
MRGVVSEHTSAAYPYPATPLVPQWGRRKAQLQAAFAVGAALVALMFAPHANSPHAMALLIVLPAALSVVLAFAPNPQRFTSAVTKDLFVVGAALAVFAGPWLGYLVACAPIGLVTGVAIGEGLTRWRGRRV